MNAKEINCIDADRILKKKREVVQNNKETKKNPIVINDIEPFQAEAEKFYQMFIPK